MSFSALLPVTFGIGRTSAAALEEDLDLPGSGVLTFRWFIQTNGTQRQLHPTSARPNLGWRTIFLW